MRAGNWVPMDKMLADSLPKDRSYSEEEAAFSLQVDYDRGSDVTAAGYAKLWRWDRGKVGRFLRKLGVRLVYPASTGKKQNQRAQITLQNPHRLQLENAQIRLIDSKWLRDDANRSQPEDAQITLRSCSTTRNPNPKPEKTITIDRPDGGGSVIIVESLEEHWKVVPLRKEKWSVSRDELVNCFEELWKAYPRKEGKEIALKHFMKTVWSSVDIDEIGRVFDIYLNQVEGKDHQDIEPGHDWFRHWEDHGEAFWVTVYDPENGEEYDDTEQLRPPRPDGTHSMRYCDVLAKRENLQEYKEWMGLHPDGA